MGEVHEARSVAVQAVDAGADDVGQAFDVARAGFADWDTRPAEDRAERRREDERI